MFNEMKTSRDSQATPEIKAITQASHESQSDQPNKKEALVPDSSSATVASSDGCKVSREDIELVQNLIERCLQLYMNRDEVVKTLLNRARIDPGFTTLVNNLPMGYPVLQPRPIPVTGQPHLDSMSRGISSCHLVNGVPVPSNFQPMRVNSGNGMAMESSYEDAAPVILLNSGVSSMSDVPISPASVASSGHFPFTASEISRRGVDTSGLDAFQSDVGSSIGLQLPPDGGAGNSNDSLRSLAQIPWNFSLSDLTTDLFNLEDLGPLGNYPGSSFLPSDSDILLDSPEQEDIVEEFFVDSVPGPPPQSDEEKS